MLFMIKGRDGENTEATRKKYLAKHLDYVEDNMATIRVAGPLRNNDDGPIVGSLYIIEAIDDESAQKFIQSDPYFDTGIWAELEITSFRSVAGIWVGGRNW